MSYKNLLNEIHARMPSPTKKQIDKCLANEAANKKRVRKPLTLAQRQVRFNAKIQRRATKNNMTAEEWWKQSMSYYTIDDSFSVISVARSPNKPPKVWGPFADKLAAEEKIYQLISYKDHDHFVRGHDFAW